MNEVLKKIGQTGIVPVVVLNEVKDAVPLAQSLINGGLPCAAALLARALLDGERHPHDFPQPAAPLEDDPRLWRICARDAACVPGDVFQRHGIAVLDRPEYDGSSAAVLRYAAALAAQGGGKAHRGG